MFIQFQCKKLINNTTHEWTTINTKNGTSDGYSFNQANYDAGKCGTGHTLSKNIIQGNVKYDAATTNIGVPWKMFTQAQGQELIDNTTRLWTTMNGVNGGKFTSKSDSSKYIFFPAAGWWENTTHNSAGSLGGYWCSTLRNSSYAWQLRFSSGTTNMDYFYRCHGYSIRGVQY